MKKETEVTLTLKTLTVSQNLVADPQGFMFKVFMACSRADSRVFKVHSNIVNLNQTIKIKNINPKQLQFWLCTTNKKIIAVAILNLNQQDGQFNLDLKMLSTEFGKLNGSLQIRQYQIQKQVYVQPDQQLLKKKEDPQKKKKQQQQIKKAKLAAQSAQAAKNVKKPAVTLTRFNKKDQPFV